VHGRPRLKTWAYLTETIEIGTKTIKTNVETDWDVGDVVVIPSTSYDMNEAEVKTIQTKIDT